jgi:hypothetical protein
VTNHYKNVAEIVDPGLAAVAEALDPSRREWLVIGNWALDLFMNKNTRPHKDV